MPAQTGTVGSAAPANSAPAPARDAHRPPDPSAGIEASASARDIAPVIEDAAILFANGQADQALARLSTSVREDDLGKSAMQCWLMLLDLYQHLGMRTEFEALALEFVVKFERSAPMWIDSGAQTRSSREIATGGTGYCAFAGTLSAASEASFSKLQSIGQGQQIIRIDFGKLQGVDAVGAARLHDALLQLRAGGKEVVITGEAQLIKLLEDACRAGDARTPGALWSLLFELYRWFGLQDRFEDAAVNYAVTFEVSPPSWETPAPGRIDAKPASSGGDASDPALVLSGEITGAGEELVRQLRDWAAANGLLVIDLSKAKRVDFVSAGVLFSTMSKLRQAGIGVQVRGASEMIAALFEVMGIQSVAKMTPRK